MALDLPDIYSRGEDPAYGPSGFEDGLLTGKSFGVGIVDVVGGDGNSLLMSLKPRPSNFKNITDSCHG